MSVVMGRELVERIRRGEERACGRLMTWAERGDPRFSEAYDTFFAELGAARR